MIAKNVIENIIQDAVKEKNAFIVDISVSTSNKINIEIDSMDVFSIDDCVDISRLVESKLDRDEEDFELEVSSAGLSQPFKVIQQYHKNLNKEVEVLTKEGKKIVGVLSKVLDDSFEISEEKLVKVEGKKKKQNIIENHTFTFDKVKYVKLVIKFK